MSRNARTGGSGAKPSDMSRNGDGASDDVEGASGVVTQENTISSIVGNLSASFSSRIKNSLLLAPHLLAAVTGVVVFGKLHHR